MCVVFGNEGERDVVIVGSESGEGRHDDAVLELEVAQFEGLEESGGGHDCGRVLLQIVYFVYCRTIEI